MDVRCYKKEEVEEVFRSLPTCKNDIIEISELHKLFDGLGYKYTKEQLGQYEKFHREFTNGNVPLDFMRDVLAVLNDGEKCMRVCINACDADKDGFISDGEFKSLVELIQIHDPKLPKISFQNFVEEADTNKDGKVSIDEALEWFSKAGKK